MRSSFGNQLVSCLHTNNACFFCFPVQPIVPMLYIIYILTLLLLYFEFEFIIIQFHSIFPIQMHAHVLSHPSYSSQQPENLAHPKPFKTYLPAQQHRAFGKEISNIVRQTYFNDTYSPKHVSPKSTASNPTLEKANAESFFKFQGHLNDPQSNLESDLLELNNFISTFLTQINQAKNPQYTHKYADDIFTYLDENEIKYVAPPLYMDNFQNDINPRMRTILIDWIEEVHMKFQLLPETLYLTINLIDRYLSQNKCTKNLLQLVGVTSLFIAAKYEEIYPPELKDYVYICDKAYTKQQILKMEGDIIQCIGFELTYVSPLKFLQRYLQLKHRREDNAIFDSKEYLLGSYLLELCLHDYYSLQFQPSLVAAGALYLSQKLLGIEQNVQSIYEEQSLKKCGLHILGLQKATTQGMYSAVKRKYSIKKYMEVSSIGE